MPEISRCCYTFCFVGFSFEIRSKHRDKEPASCSWSASNKKYAAGKKSRMNINISTSKGMPNTACWKGHLWFHNFHLFCRWRFNWRWPRQGHWCEDQGHASLLLASVALRRGASCRGWKTIARVMVGCARSKETVEAPCEKTSKQKAGDTRKNADHQLHWLVKCK